MDLAMRVAMAGILLALALGGCAMPQDEPSQDGSVQPAVSGTQDLLLDEQDLQELGLEGHRNNSDLADIGITFNETACRTEGYETHERAPLAQYSICSYTIDGLEDTEVIIELKRFTDIHDLNGSYQYDSSHHFSAEGLISDDEYGDQSRFRVNSEQDYGGQRNDPDVYYYHLWITKDLYLIHITSSGSEEARDSIEDIGQRILSKFA